MKYIFLCNFLVSKLFCQRYLWPVSRLNNASSLWFVFLISELKGPAGSLWGVFGNSIDFSSSATNIEPRRPELRFVLRVGVLSAALVIVFEFRLEDLSPLYPFGVSPGPLILPLILVGVLDGFCLLGFSCLFLFCVTLPLMVHLIRIFDFFDSCCGVSKMLFYLVSVIASKFSSTYFEWLLIDLARSRSALAIIFLDSASRTSTCVSLLWNYFVPVSYNISVFKENDWLTVAELFATCIASDFKEFRFLRHAILIQSPSLTESVGKSYTTSACKVNPYVSAICTMGSSFCSSEGLRLVSMFKLAAAAGFFYCMSLYTNL